MKLIMKQHLSGASGVLSVGDVIEVDDITALRYIKKDIAIPKVEKELKELLSRAEAIEVQEKEAQAQASAILRKSVIQNELNELYLAVVLKEAELNGEVLNDEEILEAVESLTKRDSLVNKKAGSK